MNAASTARSAPAGSWRIRRRIVFLTLAFCAVTVAWCLLRGDDTRVAETAVLSAFALAGSVVGAYVFGAAWEDIRNRDAMGGQP